MIESVKKHYHWIIAGLVFLEMIVFGGLLNSSGVYVQPVSSDFGISTTTLAVAGMPYTVLAFVSTCFTGFLFSRFGYKKAAIFHSPFLVWHIMARFRTQDARQFTFFILPFILPLIRLCSDVI